MKPTVTGSNHKTAPITQTCVHKQKSRPQKSQLNALAPEFQNNSSIDNTVTQQGSLLQGDQVGLDESNTKTAKVTSLCSPINKDGPGHAFLNSDQSSAKVGSPRCSVIEDLKDQDAFRDMGDIQLQCQETLISDKRRIPYPIWDKRTQCEGSLLIYSSLVFLSS